MKIETLEVGTLVNINPAYIGNGQYALDGHEGIYTVVGHLNSGTPGDYYLAKGDLRHDPRKSLWDVICNVSRINVLMSA